MNLPALSLLETRVLGVLVEKQHTVPDTYPLTLNTLVGVINPTGDESGTSLPAAFPHLRPAQP